MYSQYSHRSLLKDFTGNSLTGYPKRKLFWVVRVEEWRDAKHPNSPKDKRRDTKEEHESYGRVAVNQGPYCSAREHFCKEIENHINFQLRMKASEIQVQLQS